MSPIELRKAVKRIGFFDTPAMRGDSAKTLGSTAPRSVLKTIDAVKPPLQRSADKVVKTVINLPAIKPSADKQARRENQNTKRDRT
jgi:hypothetical protein